MAGGRLDYARGSSVGATVEAWCALHFPTITKDFNLKIGVAAAGKLAAEWCRKMQWFYDLWCLHGSWEAAGGARAIDTYAESEDYARWLDAQPAGEARTKGLEVRKLRPLLL